MLHRWDYWGITLNVLHRWDYWGITLKSSTWQNALLSASTDPELLITEQDFALVAQENFKLKEQLKNTLGLQCKLQAQY